MCMRGFGLSVGVSLCHSKHDMNGNQTPSSLWLSRLDGFMVNQQSVFWGYFHSAQPEWPGLLPSNLEDSSSNPHKSIAGVFSSSINLSEGSLLPYP